MIAVDIGGSHISNVEVVDVLLGKLVDDIRSHHISVLDLEKDKLLDSWAMNINLTIAASEMFDGNIAIAFPGPFDYDLGIVESHFNGKFRQLVGVNIKKELSKRISACERIHFENDATCFGLGEYYYGGREKSKKLLALTIGTGIGSSFIDNGKAIRNSKSVPYGGEVYNLSFMDKTADDYFSTRWFVSESKKMGIEVSGVRELIQNANADLINEVFDRFADNFKVFFSPVVKSFDAKVIVIGGNISKAWEYIGPRLTEYFEGIGIRFEKSVLGETAICLGAARSMLNNNKS